MRQTPVNDYLKEISTELPEEIYGCLSDAIYETTCEFDEEVGLLKAENAKLRTKLTNVTESMGRVEERCAKLREERDEWHRVAVSKQDIIDHMRDARAENAKLRELAAETIRLMQADGPDCGLCKHYDECWTSDAMNYSPSGCVICNEARELGIEV